MPWEWAKSSKFTLPMWWLNVTCYQYKPCRSRQNVLQITNISAGGWQQQCHCLVLWRRVQPMTIHVPGIWWLMMSSVSSIATLDELHLHLALILWTRQSALKLCLQQLPSLAWRLVCRLIHRRIGFLAGIPFPLPAASSSQHVYSLLGSVCHVKGRALPCVL